MNWIKINDTYYNIEHTRKITIDSQINIEFSNGESMIIYKVLKQEKDKLIKLLDNDSK